MPSSYTPSLRLTLPVTGSLSGTWGDTVNSGITALLDSSVAGTAAVTMTDANYTLTTANGATDEARKMFVTLTGTLTAARDVICPSASKLYFIKNTTTGGFAVTLKTSAGTGISVPNGKSMVLYCDGTNVLDATNHYSSITIATALAATSGGTGQASYTTGDLLYASSSSALSKLGVGTAGQVLTSSGTAPQWTTLTGVAVTTFSAGTTGFTPSTATSGAVTLAGTLATTNGGTGLTSFTSGGVVYASSSSALATGSVLTFDGNRLASTTGKFGAGVAANSASLMVNNAANNATGIQLFQDGIESWIMGLPANSSALTWANSGTEQMRLTSTGLGIGTSSPGYKLDVAGTAGISGAVTLSGGTANGVAYLNGSKVLTTGSALTFNGNALSVVGTNPGIAINDSTASVGVSFSWLNGGANYSYGQVALRDTTNSQTAYTYFSGASGYHNWFQNNTEQMRLTSTGLGIGTSSPSSRLHVQGSGDISRFSNGTVTLFGYSDSQGLGWFTGAGATGVGAYYNNVNNYQSFYTVGSERARLDSAGNLGLGVTPSVWESTVKAFQFGSLGYVARGSSGQTIIGYNNYLNASNQFIYSATTQASRYEQISGEHRFFNAPSGTAGNAITFTQAMTLDSSGNLGLGVTPSAWSDIKPIEFAGSSFFGANASGTGVWFGNNCYYDGTNWRAKVTAASGYATISQGNFLWTSAPSVTAGSITAPVTRMTLDTSGNLGLGVNPSAWAAGYKSADIGLASFLSLSTAAYMASNGYDNSGWKYKSTAFAALYAQDTGGQHVWYNAPSGTAGNAITFTQAMTLNASGNLGVGTSLPGAKLDVAGLVRSGGNATYAGDVVIQQVANTSNSIGGLEFKADSANNGYGARLKSLFNGISAYDFAFQMRNNSATWTTQMLIDSAGNVGIGTTSPGYRLDIAGTNPRIRISETTGYVLTTYANTGGSFDVGRDNSAGAVSGAAYAGFLNVGGAYPLIFNTNGAERMRLDASGNLGLGVTPSAWAGGFKPIQILQSAIAAYNDGAGNLQTEVQTNAYQSSLGIYRYVVNGAALQYRQVVGSGHSWNIASAGTAGNAITFTQAMTLDASGNLGIGATSIQGAFNIERSSSTSASTAIPAIVLSNRNSTSGTFVAGGVFSNTYRDISSSNYTAGVWFEKQNDAISGAASSQGAVVFGANGSNLGGNLPVERMRLDASGNLGLGVTPSGWGTSGSVYNAFQYGVSGFLAGRTGNEVLLLGSGAYNDGTNWRYSLTGNFASFYQQASGVHSWYVAPTGTAGNTITFTQAMTLDASGNLLVGTTSLLTGFSGARFTSVGTTGLVAQASAAANEAGAFWNTATSSNNTFLIFGTEATYTGRGSITYNRAGGLVAYNTTSDYRAKDIIGPVQNAGATIDALKVYEGKMKGATQSRPMLIAHEAQVVTPYAVTGEKDQLNEDGTPKFQQMDVSSLVPLLLAEIQSLRARVAQLEAK